MSSRYRTPERAIFFRDRGRLAGYAAVPLLSLGCPVVSAPKRAPFAWSRPQYSMRFPNAFDGAAQFAQQSLQYTRFLPQFQPALDFFDGLQLLRSQLRVRHLAKI